MTMPPLLWQRTAASLEALRQHLAGDLNLGYRETIWAALGPRAPDQDPEMK
jgi:hypothetical protein